jgi:hypothetical protein
MVITQRTAASVSRLMLRGALVSLLAAGVVALSSPEAWAQGRRARLSEDLEERLRTGDTSETSVIITGTQASVNAVAARHGLRIRKRLRSGAVLDVPAGRLNAVADDQRISHVSGIPKLKANGSIWSGLARIIHEGADFSASAGDRRVKPRCQGDTDEAKALRERNLTRTASTTRMRTALRP